MGEPSAVRWADVDVADAVVEPAESKKDDGWQVAEKPAREYMNWIHYTTYLWAEFLKTRIKNNEALSFITTGLATWSGTQLILSANLDITFREEAGARRANRLASGTFSITDGHVLLFIPDRTNSTPVALTLAASYAALAAGKYVIVAESSLDLDDFEDEVILFRRRGTDLEFVPEGRIIPAPARFYFGQYNGGPGTKHGGTVSTTDATVTDLAAVALAEGEAAIVRATVIGRKSDGSAFGAWVVVANFHRNAAGNVALEAATSVQYEDNQAAWGGVEWLADTGNQTMDLRVTGLAGTTINWSSQIEVLKVT